jgi:hypothetical protein
VRIKLAYKIHSHSALCSIIVSTFVITPPSFVYLLNQPEAFLIRSISSLLKSTAPNQGLGSKTD